MYGNGEDRGLTLTLAGFFLLIASFALAADVRNSKSVGGAGGGLKVAMIDVNRILNESEAGKAAKKWMEYRYNELKKQVEADKNIRQKAENEMKSLQRDLTREVLKQVEVQVDRAVAEEEIDLVLETKGDGVVYYSPKLNALILTATGVDIGSFQIKEREGMIRKYLATNADSVGKNPFETHPDLDITAKVMKMLDEETRLGK